MTDRRVPDPPDDVLRIINEAPIGRDWDEHSAPALLDALAAAGAVVVFAEGLPMGARLHVHRVDEDGLMWLWTNPRRVLTDKEPPADG